MKIRSYESVFPHGLMFHRFHEDGGIPTGQGSMTPSELDEILNFVGIKNILSPDEWLIRLHKKVLRKIDFCITFDDGLRSQFDCALPVLENYGLKAFWFVYSTVFEGGMVKAEIYNYFGEKFFNGIDEFFEKFFGLCGQDILDQCNTTHYKKFASEVKKMFPFYTDSDLKYRFIRNRVLSADKFDDIMNKLISDKGLSLEEMARKIWLSDSKLKVIIEKGHHLGLHSYDHPFSIADLPEEEQKQQYERNISHLKRVDFKTVRSVSHPLNSYNHTTLKILAELGVVCGFRSNMLPPDGKNINPNHLELAREDSTNLLKLITKK